MEAYLKLPDLVAYHPQSTPILPNPPVLIKTIRVRPPTASLPDDIPDGVDRGNGYKAFEAHGKRGSALEFECSDRTCYEWRLRPPSEAPPSLTLLLKHPVYPVRLVAQRLLEVRQKLREEEVERQKLELLLGYRDSLDLPDESPDASDRAMGVNEPTMSSFPGGGPQPTGIGNSTPPLALEDPDIGVDGDWDMQGGEEDVGGASDHGATYVYEDPQEQRRQVQKEKDRHRKASKVRTRGAVCSPCSYLPGSFLSSL